MAGKKVIWMVGGHGGGLQSRTATCLDSGLASRPRLLSKASTVYNPVIYNLQKSQTGSLPNALSVSEKRFTKSTEAL